MFLDESGFALSLSLPYGWGKRGEPLVEAVPSRRGKNLSVLGAVDMEGVVAQASKQGAMTRADVERFFQQDLLPQLLPGSVLVLDNAPIHKGGNIEALAQGSGTGCGLSGVVLTALLTGHEPHRVDLERCQAPGAS